MLLDKFRFIWGGIANDTDGKIVRIDLLNQDISIKKVLKFCLLCYGFCGVWVILPMVYAFFGLLNV
jgi:hypothetical protein